MDPALAAVWTVRAGLDQLTIDADGFDVIWTRWAGRQWGAVLERDENVDEERPLTDSAKLTEGGIEEARQTASALKDTADQA